jgi:hypothetical protein
LEQYIPKQIYLQVFKPDKWASALDERRSRLHTQVLTVQVQRNILPRWEDNQEYPTQIDGENDTEAHKASRMIFFEKQAAKDGDALQMFVGGMGDSIDWQQIAQKETDEDMAAWTWAVKSLAKAANLVHELRNDDEEVVQRGRLQFSRFRNKFWEMFPADKGVEAPHHSTIAIRHRLGRHETPTRGYKRKREPEESVDSSVGMLRQRFDSNGKAFVDLTSDDEIMDIDS